ncbi:DUF998 domain-containing protein [Micromonospora sp. NPDC003197]
MTTTLTRTATPGPAPRRPGPVLTRRLLACGVLAGPLFVIAVLVQEATRADYDPLRHPVSSLALGELGWIQDGNFIVAGLLTMAFALGLRRALRPGRGATWGPLLVGCWGITLIGAGIFVTDPISGFPAGTPDQISQPTWHGILHDLVSIPGFLALPIAFVVLARRFGAEKRWRWVAYSVASAVVFVATFELSNLAFAQVASLVEYGGLFQRIAVVTGFAWLTLLGVQQRHQLDRAR